MTIPETIKYITKLRNKEVRTDSKKFKAYLKDLSPECVKELKLLNRALNDNILSIIFSSEQDSAIISKLTTEFKNMGMPDKQMNFILKSFAEVLGWNYTPPKQEESPKKEEFPIKYELTKETIETKKETRDRLSEKKIQENAPNLLSFVKPLVVEIKKRNLEELSARVALVMDISGSMSNNYSNGTVQEIVNKILPIAIEFDDDGELDFWYYGSRFQRRPPVNLKNYKNAVPSDWSNLMSSLGYGNNEPLVMKDITNKYKNSELPVYVIFISDGGFCEEIEFDEKETEQLLIDSSKMPIFWQFVGIGGSNYGILEELENLTGKYTDNANFFALDDFRSVSNSELYSRLLNKFPSWLKEAEEKKILK